MTREEIEQVFMNIPAVHPHPSKSGAEERMKAIGRTDVGRFAYVSFTIRRSDTGLLIRPISARFMHEREVKKYERQTPDQ
jgi:uncharacterized DUF497 family protein